MSNQKRVIFMLLPVVVLILLLNNVISAQGTSSSEVPFETMPIALANHDNPLAHTCKSPQTPLDVDHYPVAPHELELEQVHVFMRHGERTPVGVRLSASPASIPEHWMMCGTARRFRAALSVGAGGQGVDATGAGSLLTRKSVERKDGTSVDGECFLGELTDLGRQSTYNYGAALRKLYVDKLGFLPDSLRQDGVLYLRSTNMPRTIESLEQVVHGLYPTSKRHPSVTPPLFIRNGKDENLLGNTHACKRLEVLLAGFAQAAVAAYNPTLELLDKKLSRYLGGSPIRVDGKPRASGILDTIRAAVANGVKIPAEFEDKTVVDVIERAVVNEWFADKTEEVRRLGMGRMLDDVSRKMQFKAQRGDADPLKILVHSTHDTALAALCSTLDVFDEKWPPFTAAATFELFKKKPHSAASPRFQGFVASLRGGAQQEHYVRMRYQNRTMILPICAEEGKHLPGSPEFCTLAAFQERVKELAPADWDAECAPSPGGR